MQKKKIKLFKILYTFPFLLPFAQSNKRCNLRIAEVKVINCFRSFVMSQLTIGMCVPKKSEIKLKATRV